MREKTVLVVAGLDPSGGAGLAADLRAIAAAGAWGAPVCAALTVQSTRGVRAVHAVRAGLVLDQAREVLGDAFVRVIKTGALGSAANARAVATLFDEHAALLKVVDPVMAPSRGEARLDGARAVAAMRLLALRGDVLVTPNLRETTVLLGEDVVTIGGAEAAARALVARGARAALVKGGHGEGAQSIDYLATKRWVRAIARPRKPGLDVHGTGCTLASLIAGALAASGRRGAFTDGDLEHAVSWARDRLDAALGAPRTVGGGLPVIAP